MGRSCFAVVTLALTVGACAREPATVEMRVTEVVQPTPPEDTSVEARIETFRRENGLRHDDPLAGYTPDWRNAGPHPDQPGDTLEPFDLDEVYGDTASDPYAEYRRLYRLSEPKKRCSFIVTVEASGRGEWEAIGGRFGDGADSFDAAETTDLLGRNRIRRGSPIVLDYTVSEGEWLILLVRWRHMRTGEVVAPHVVLTC